MAVKIVAASRSWAFALATVLAVGCGRNHRDQGRDPVLDAYKLIDADRDDEAILLLEGELSRMSFQPDHAGERNRLIVVLASAYAHKAGVKVQRFVKILNAGKLSVKFDLKAKVDGKMGRVEAFDGFLGVFGGYLRSLANTTAIYTAVPTVSEEQEKPLEHALGLLDGLDAENLRPSEALYRVVIRVVYLKRYLATRVFSDQTVGPEFEAATCSINFEKISLAVAESGRLMVKMLNDMAIAQPKKAKDFERQRIRVTQVVADLTRMTTSVSLVDELSSRVAKRTLAQAGLQKLLKCGSEVDGEPSIRSLLSSGTDSSGSPAP